MPKTKECPNCAGRGVYSFADIDCDQCDGTGFARETTALPAKLTERELWLMRMAFAKGRRTISLSLCAWLADEVNDAAYTVEMMLAHDAPKAEEVGDAID